MVDPVDPTADVTVAATNPVIENPALEPGRCPICGEIVQTVNPIFAARRDVRDHAEAAVRAHMAVHGGPNA